MSFLSKIFSRGPKPVIAHSKEGNLGSLTAQQAGPASPGAVKKPDVYYVTASVELGNTTTKCIVMATNLNTSESYLLNKTVKMTRDIRPPKPSEEVFGKTVWGIELSKEAVTELIRDTVLESLRKCNVDKDKDLDFVVRCLNLCHKQAMLLCVLFCILLTSPMRMERCEYQILLGIPI